MLLMAVSCIYLMRIPQPSLRGEESRWARVAYEMIETGDWVVPRQQSRPFLDRRPLQPWLIATVAIARGKVDLLAIRLPTVIATLLTTVLVYGYARSFLAPLGALTAAASFATMAQVLALGRLSETEAVFTLLVSGSLLLWHLGYMRR